jgi:hypothetical protein
LVRKAVALRPAAAAPQTLTRRADKTRRAAEFIRQLFQEFLEAFLRFGLIVFPGVRQ